MSLSWGTARGGKDQGHGACAPGGTDHCAVTSTNLAQAGNKLRAPKSLDCDGEGPCHAKPCHTKLCRAVPCWPSTGTGEEPKETTVPGSAGRCSPGLGGKISDLCVQSQEQEEGAEPAGRVFKFIGSRSSRRGRGKGAACLIIALIKQARSEQDPTLSTPQQGLCRSCQGQVPPHPSIVHLPPFQGDHPIPSHPHLYALLQSLLPRGFPIPTRQQGAPLGSPWTCSPRARGLLGAQAGTGSSRAVGKEGQGAARGCH